jgi:hypothetical protein
MAFAYTESTNTVVATGGTSGTPLTFDDFVTADRAGTATLLVATAGLSPTLALTYQIRPVDVIALLITFTVASKTTETDYIFITGTDWRDAAQTESIDVSAGNGAYVSTKYFRTITNIDCSDNAAGGGTQWADGTVAVTQPQWGVIWDFSDGQYKIDCLHNIGNGSTPTYFQTKSESVVYSINQPRGHGESTFIIGEPSNTVYSKSSSYIKMVGKSFGRQLQSYGTINIYGSIIEWSGDQLWWGASGTFNVYDSIFNGNGQTLAESTAGTTVETNWKRSYITNVGSFAFATTPTSFDDMVIENMTIAGLNNYNGVVLSIPNALITNSNPDLRTNGSGSETNLVNPKFNITNPLIAYATNIIREQYTTNVHVTDKAGANLAGVTVNLKGSVTSDYDTDAWTADSVTTAAGGTITEQTITTKSWTGTSETLTDYNVFRMTLSKAGYETLVLDNITIDSPIVWHLELQHTKGAKSRQIGMGV